ncbi:hypothetical protein CNBH4050 [Cryptococcus deneoformans B-3501A]|uniref:Uncharacterized protein n=1 Tax=Cryptococcus deneoformans (strain JEC21 / ATCC MYA-565) TaxID=214684 RepID=Q5KB04_CRYD1|nr:hypothetical protein CNI04240 [Cryptococcus neoformans var. neoformans JEC21]XP_773953.1 hypothetical protein CNBH4050 [Cryptococcus neoformans var. neoformans B-3501A]AAW45712.1 hypothetical protein CNI04240 [Cryptococcus neoformans var. neoformans JEC21]EAL19306.1 hypothetical protein CNBH4050 [Cryptococcus neoformans var. neoformans B-3501A]
MKYKGSNPFQTSLYITSLPPGIRPAHLNRILAHPPRPLGKRRRKRDTGVELIQIYTIPKKPKRRYLPKSRSTQPTGLLDPRHSPPQAIERVVSLLRTILCIPHAPDLGPQRPATSTEEGSLKSQLSISSPLPSGVGDRNGTGTEVVVERELGEGELNEDENDQTTMVDEDENVMDQKQEADGEETVGYIHFCCEQHMYLGKRILRHVTIDGYRPKVRTRRFNVGILRHWARPIGRITTNVDRKDKHKP